MAFLMIYYDMEKANVFLQIKERTRNVLPIIAEAFGQRFLFAFVYVCEFIVLFI